MIKFNQKKNTPILLTEEKMKILDNSDKRLLPVLPAIVFEKLGRKIESTKFVGGGSFGRVYKVILSDGEAIALKAYRIQGSQNEEAEQLRLLSEHTSVKMPKVLFTYSDEKTAVLAMTFVPGKNALNPLFLFKSKQQKQAFADEVISGMLEWHSVTNEKFGALTNPSYDSWYDCYKTEKQQPWLEAFKRLNRKGELGRKNLDLLLEAAEIFDSLPQERTAPVLIHGDLNIMNIMAEPKTFKLTAFIDPCGSFWADHEYDLFQLRNMWGDAYGLYETYKRRGRTSKFTDFRVAYYGAMHETSMRLKGGHIEPFLEIICNKNLKREMAKLKEMM